MTDATYLVTLATGRQGTATANELRKKGKFVNVLVRNRSTAPAKALRDLGCILFEGTPDNTAVVKAAIKGVTGLFINIFPNSEDATAELRQAETLLSAARAAQTVISVVVSTALNCAKHAQWLFDDPDYPMRHYYGRKFDIEKAVRDSGIRYYTILRPSFLMHNYLEPLWRAHFPNYQCYVLDVAYSPGTKTAHFDPYDVGQFAAAALLDPKSFDRHEIELGNEQLTIDQVAWKIGDAVGLTLYPNYLNAKQVAEIKSIAPALAIRLWGTKEDAYTNDPSTLLQYGIRLTKLAEFAGREELALSEALHLNRSNEGKNSGEQRRWSKERELGG